MPLLGVDRRVRPKVLSEDITNNAGRMIQKEINGPKNSKETLQNNVLMGKKRGWMMCCIVKNQVFLKCLYRSISDQLIKGKEKPGDIQAEKPLDLRRWQSPLGEDTPFPCWLQLLPSTLEERAADEEGGNLPMAKMTQEGRSTPLREGSFACMCADTHTCACTHTPAPVLVVGFIVLYYTVLYWIVWVLSIWVQPNSGFGWIVLNS